MINGEQRACWEKVFGGIVETFLHVYISVKPRIRAASSVGLLPAHISPRSGEVISATPVVSVLACSGFLQKPQFKGTLSNISRRTKFNMPTRTRVHLQALVLLIFLVHPSQPVCVDVPSDTEAVLGKPKMLTCISCMKREEVKAKTRVDWFYLPSEDSPRITIYTYDDDTPQESVSPFKGRLTWNGSQDLQDVSIQITNVTYSDSGIYECQVVRKFEFDFFTPSVSMSKNFTLKVREKASEDTTALYSEITMYMLLVFLTLWLLVEMVYCYRKISKSEEQAQDTATNYLAIPSEQKDNPAAPVTE